MRLMPIKLNSLEDLFIMELKDKFQQHLQVTQTQISRLEEVFDILDMEPEEEPCAPLHIPWVTMRLQINCRQRWVKNPKQINY